MELQNNSNIVETFATELNSMADSLEALVIGNQNMFVESGQNNNSLSNTTINPSQQFIPIDNTNLIPPSNVLPSPSPNSPNPSLDIVSAATDENNNEQEPEIGHNSIGHNSNDVEASEEIYNESLNDREFFTMMSTLIENRNRNMDNIPIKFMTIISKFVIDPDAECLRIPRERDHNNNEMNHVREFNRIIDCSYCGERIVNYFNNYMQHIIDKDHVLEQDNTNNIMTNLLQNNNVQQNSQNINDQYVNITNNNVVHIVRLLNQEALSNIDDILFRDGFEIFDSGNQDTNNSQEYKNKLIETISILYGDPPIIPVEHFITTTNNNLINNNINNINIPLVNNNIPLVTNNIILEPHNPPQQPPLQLPPQPLPPHFTGGLSIEDHNLIRDYMRVNGGNRFPVPRDNEDEDEDDDDDGNNYYPVRRRGIELSEHSEEYNIVIDTQCGICLENYKAVDNVKFNRLLCMHQYCNECTKKWFEKNANCPDCKTDLRTLRAINLTEIGLGGF